MKTFQKICLGITMLGLLTATAGCKKPESLQLKRSRIVLLGRILANKTCDVRLIWRAGPTDPPPVTVSADLSQIGGDAAQALTAGESGTWRWAGQVTPPAFGEETVRVTALDAGDRAYLSEKTVQVYDTAKAIAIAAGINQSLALKADGTVVQWQDEASNAHYPLAGFTDVIAIDCFGDRALALQADGTVTPWGLQSEQDLIGAVPAGLSDVVAIASGGLFNLALKADGTVVEWDIDTAGYDYSSGLLDVPDNLSDVIAITAGNDFALALKADGTVIAWGRYVKAPLTNFEDVVAVDAGWYAFLAVKSDGTVLWGSNYGHRRKMPIRTGALKAKAVAAGLLHDMALREDGTVMIWWIYNLYLFKVPYYVSDARLENIIALAEGSGTEEGLLYPFRSMALTKSGSVLVWVEHWNGQKKLTVPEELE